MTRLPASNKVSPFCLNRAVVNCDPPQTVVSSRSGSISMLSIDAIPLVTCSALRQGPESTDDGPAIRLAIASTFTESLPARCEEQELSVEAEISLEYVGCPSGVWFS